MLKRLRNARPSINNRRIRKEYRDYEAVVKNLMQYPRTRTSTQMHHRRRLSQPVPAAVKSSSECATISGRQYVLLFQDIGLEYKVSAYGLDELTRFELAIPMAQAMAYNGCLERNFTDLINHLQIQDGELILVP
jgi:hypothetical protein